MPSKTKDITIHVKKYSNEFYKYLYGLSAPIKKEIFRKRVLK